MKAIFLGFSIANFTTVANLVVVHVVDDGHHQHDFDAGFVHVFDGAKLHVKQVADLAVAVGVVADAVELQVGVAQTRCEGLLREFLALGELDAVRCSLHGVVSDLAGVADGVEEVRAHRRLATAELHGHLAARLDLHRVVENFLNLFPRKLVNIANLVRIHEARIAHHVAAIGEVHSENGAAAVTYVRRTMLMEAFIVVGRNIAAGKLTLDPLQETGVDRHQIFVVAVLRAILDHPDLTVAFDDLSLNLADLFVHEVAPIFVAIDDGFARFLNAGRAQRVGLAWET